jgi:hypothetical protein
VTDRNYDDLGRVTPPAPDAADASRLLHEELVCIIRDNLHGLGGIEGAADEIEVMWENRAVVLGAELRASIAARLTAKADEYEAMPQVTRNYVRGIRYGALVASGDIDRPLWEPAEQRKANDD